MRNLFIPYELAVIAKEKGFSQKEVFRYYSGNGDKLWNYNGKLNKEDVSAPLYQQIVDWFREKHNIIIHIKKDYDSGNLIGYEAIIDCNDGFTDVGTDDSYYIIFNKAIEESLKLI